MSKFGPACRPVGPSGPPGASGLPEGAEGLGNPRGVALGGARNPEIAPKKPWLKPLFVGVYIGESNHSRVSQMVRYGLSRQYNTCWEFPTVESGVARVVSRHFDPLLPGA